MNNLLKCLIVVVSVFAMASEGYRSKRAPRDPIGECLRDNDKLCLLYMFRVTERSIERAMSIRPVGVEETHPDEKDSDGAINVCVDSKETIDQKLPSLTMLSGNLDALPGQLTFLDQSLAKGRPVSVPLKRKPITLLIDLPGARPIRVRHPDKPSEIYQAIDQAREEFFKRNEEAARKKGTEAGNVGAYTINHLESSSDLLAHIKLGFNAQDQASGIKGKIDVNATTKTKTRVLYTKFQQKAFQVIVDAVSDEDIFDDTVTAAQVYRAMKDPNDPKKLKILGMHKRGIFGRIVLLKSTFKNVNDSVDLEAVVKYAMAGKKAEAEINSEYEKTMEDAEFSLTVVGSTEVSIIQDHNELMDKINETMMLSRSSPPALIEVSTIAVRNGLPATTVYRGDMITTTCTKYQGGWVDFKSTDWEVKNTLETVDWKLKDLKSKTGEELPECENGSPTCHYQHHLRGSGKAPAANLPANAINVHTKVINCGWGSCNTLIYENVSPSGPPNVCLIMKAYGFLSLKTKIDRVEVGKRCN